ncbi:hypothetical protein GQ55_8G196100 [Panicum hallii var. hallii]|uniref:DEK-C domain-containing protein n=2 Tax=Panicum hallii TaxID=206008 RepID=A0A2T7CP52_9POAL|nr:protein starmaker [Panicum hallii]PAN42963.1 hypothetical protein PAHAL_8G201600 [Panicum hallii]PUZ45127.1 hypothetical protein GQ55_8G196100 [Panicum hallii var. hallii]
MGDAADATAGAAREREAEIEKAMRARVPDFKKQADSLTLEGVRRALEKDLGLETYSLDAHKKFIKQCVDKVFAESDDENTNDNASEDADAKDDNLSKEGPDDAKPTPVSKKTSSSADDQVVRSSETGKDPEGEKDKTSSSDISEDMIKGAIEKRASYFRKNSETLTLQGVRRTLEEDLKLQKKALDAYKNFITTELDKVLQEPANGTKKKSKKGPPMDTDQKTSKGSKRTREDSDSSELNNSQSEMEDSDEDTRPRKKRAEKGKIVKKQKKVADEKKLSKKVAKRDSDRNADEQGGNSAEEDNSHSSAEEDNKRKRQQAPAYGKHVEHLKSIIKSCGMTIPPTVYRKAKQAPEHKREACLIKELEDMLKKEGLSKNPSEKEIKAVKKRKERAKELEGIDMSNIITSSRRRSTSNFIPLPPPPKIEADSDDDEDDDAQDNDEYDQENVEGGDKGDNDDAEAGDDAAKDSN